MIDFRHKNTIYGIKNNRRPQNRIYQGEKKIAGKHTPQTIISSSITVGKTAETLQRFQRFFAGLDIEAGNFHTTTNLPLAKLTYNHKQCLKTTMKCFGRLNTGLSPQNQNLTKGA